MALTRKAAEGQLELLLPDQDVEAWEHAVLVTTMHASRTTLMRLIANIQAALRHVNKIAQQLPAVDRWKTLPQYIVARRVPRQHRKLLDTGQICPANCGF